MADHEGLGAPGAWERADEILNRTERMLNYAVELVGQAGSDPMEVFVPPSSVRAETTSQSTLTEEQRSKLYENADFLGFGKRLDIIPSEIHLAGAVAIIEGGNPDKMYAELSLLEDDTYAKPACIVMTASPYRRIESDAEKQSAHRLTGHVGETEYDVARNIPAAFDGFEPYDEPKVWPASYDVRDYYRVRGQAIGEQFTEIGTLHGVPVAMMRIERIPNENDKGYHNQPTTADVIGILDEVMKLHNDIDTPFVHITGGAYPSRELGVALAGLTVGRLVGTAYYGTDRINRVKGTPDAPPPLGQMEGELNRVAQETARLRTAMEIDAMEVTSPLPGRQEQDTSGSEAPAQGRWKLLSQILHWLSTWRQE